MRIGSDRDGYNRTHKKQLGGDGQDGSWSRLQRFLIREQRKPELPSWISDTSGWCSRGGSQLKGVPLPICSLDSEM
jgi:hypothetical protein